MNLTDGLAVFTGLLAGVCFVSLLLFWEQFKRARRWEREAANATERATYHLNSYLDVATSEFAIRREADRWKKKYIARMRNSVPKSAQKEIS